MAFTKVVPESKFKTIKWTQDPEKKGEYLGKEIEGNLLSREVREMDNGPATIYKIVLAKPEEKAGEEYELWGTKYLNDRLEQVEIGCAVRIKFLGKAPGKNYYLFDVEMDEENKIEVKVEDQG